MKKFGVITESDKQEFEQTVEKYWKRYKKSFHPNFLDGVEFVMKHLNVVESVDEHKTICIDKENIFAGANFGDKFLIRDGRVSSFCGLNEMYGTHNYLLIIPAEPEEECNVYADILCEANGKTLMGNSDYDVVSRLDEHSSDDYERGIADTINWIYQNLALDGPIPEKMIKEDLLNKK